MTASNAQIAISRLPAGLFGIARKLRVLVDGELIGSVSHGGRAVFEVEPGKHHVTVAMDWYRSEPRPIRVAAGQTIELCAHSRHMPNFVLNLPGVLLWPRRFFVVRPLTEKEQPRAELRESQ